jgi:hypothetical protein
MNKYWFAPKRYGYGATPVTWEGWAVTGAGIAVILLAVLLPVSERANLAAWIGFMAVVGVTVAILWIISRRKTDGEWRWRWGKEHE